MNLSRNSVVAAFVVALAVVHGQPAPQPSWWDRVQTAWKQSLKLGRPVAERFAKQFPKKFKEIRHQTEELIGKGQQAVVDAKLEEKKELVLELWHMRQALNLAALMDPELLHELTGLDTKSIAKLEAQVTGLQVKLQSQIAALSARAKQY